MRHGPHIELAFAVPDDLAKLLTHETTLSSLHRSHESPTAMIFSQYASYDGVGLASLVRKGEVSAAEIAEAAIARIEQYNPALNAVVTRLYDRGRMDARRASDGPFAGTPFLLKDILGDLEGVETRNGSRFKRGHAARRDSTLTRRYLAAGVTILGKTNVPEFGMTPSTESVLYGPARNPWNVEYSTGGSSGGAAAAVAIGMVPIAHGGDAGGSIRMPASCCGVVGLKPTRGRNPLGPDAGDLMAGFLQEHILSRSVRDSAAMLDCTHGPEIGDPYSAPPVAGDFIDEVGRDPGRLRIALTTSDLAGQKAHSDCIEAVDKVATVLSGLGHEIEETAMPASVDLLTASMTLGAACIAHEIDAHAEISGKTPGSDELEPAIWQLYQSGKRVAGTEYVAAIERVQSISRRIARCMERFDVWMSPTLGAPPQRLGSISGLSGTADGGLASVLTHLSYVLIANATGQPAISLPLHWTSAGLPVGVMFTGRFGDEGTLFRLAGQLEQTMPWRHRRPPMWT